MIKDRSEKLQQKIIGFLKSGPVPKSSIYDKFEKNFTNQKALQRLLVVMQKDGLIEATGERRARLYSLPNAKGTSQSLMMPLPLRPSDFETKKTFSEYMPYLELYFSRKPSERGWVGFDAKRLHLSTLLSEESLSLLEGLPTFDDKEDLGSTYASGAATTFLNQFSFNSSRLEGAVENLADTLSILQQPDSHEDNEKKIVVINHKRAVDTLIPWIVNDEYQLEEDLAKSAQIIKEIHALLMEGLLSDDSGGEVRSSEVRILGSCYLPTQNNEVLEKSLHELAKEAGKTRNPFERSFYLLALLSYLQAFQDGNKRTARLISNIPLIATRKSPHIFALIEEEDFDKAIVYFYETADVRPLERLWLESYIEGAKLFKITQKDFRNADLAKAELAPLRWLVIKDVVQKHLKPEEYIGAVEYILGKTSLKDKYPVSLLLKQVVMGLEKLSQSSIGAMAQGVSEAEIESWRKITKS